MNGREESYRSIRSTKPSNNADKAAEMVEKRDLAKGNPDERDTVRTQGREAVQNSLARIRGAADRDKEQRFTALFHHVYDVDTLREAFFSLKRKAAPGVDGISWRDYHEDHEKRLKDLSEKLRRGAYRAKPVLRQHIPKPDGSQRPIGMTTTEDKIVQRAMVAVLNAIYETDFLGFSRGFRPGRSQHEALDALNVGLQDRRINWVLDADIRGYFEAIDHEWLVKFIEHRVADRRVVRHIQKWLNAGVMDEGRLLNTEEGCPQGGSVCPLLANIYLHYVFDLWAQLWRERKATGDVILARWADDIVVGFQHRAEAEQFLRDLRTRFRKFNLELHPDKTRLLEFGRSAASNRRKRGEGKPETFDFLGFTHYCGTTRDGRFVVKRRTARKKMRAKLDNLKQELRRRINYRLPDIGQWLASVLRGHYQYYAVPLNFRALEAFRRAVIRLWKQTLLRKSQKARCPWDRMERLAKKWLPKPRILHPYPYHRLRRLTQGRNPVR